MIVVMKPNCKESEVAEVVGKIRQAGLKEHISQGAEHTIVGIIGRTFPELHDSLEFLPGVEEVILVSKPYKLSSREFHPLDTTVQVGNVIIGGKEIVVIAGPC